MKKKDQKEETIVLDPKPERERDTAIQSRDLSTQLKKEKGKGARCPFDRTLECHECRLYQTFPGCDQKVCTLVRIANWMP